MIKTFDEYIKEYYNNLGFIKSRLNYCLINESQESKSQSEAVKLVMHKLGWDKAKADNFIRVDLRNDITPLIDKQIGKFTLGITRMYLNNEIEPINEFIFVLVSWDYDELYKYASKLNIGESKIIRI